VFNALLSYNGLVSFYELHDEFNLANNLNSNSLFVFKLIKSVKILAQSKSIIKSVEDILAERYAKGELNREQYIQMKEDLKKVQ
jgi:hypothetical protein